MKNPQPSWVSLTIEQQSELESLVVMPGWRLLSQESIPSVFPQDFAQKLDSAVMIAAPTSSGGTYLVCNGLRADMRTKKIDQEPFAVIVHSSGADPSGMFLHHGDWKGRTRNPPEGFWNYVEESGVGNYFLTNPPSGQSSGSLDQLRAGQKQAFDSVVSYYRSSNSEQ